MKNNVRNVRLSMQLSQKDLATLLNTTRNTVSAIETGKYMPSAYLAALICDTLKTPFEKLFFFEYEGVRAYFDFTMPKPFTDYIKDLHEQVESCCKLDEEIKKLTTMNPFFE